MGLKVACRELIPESTCPYVASGETMAELTEDVGRHVREVHKYTKEQMQALHTPEMMEKVKAKATRE